MEMQDITDWASESRKTIELSHGFGNAKYKLQLREFVPTDGDTLFEAWSDGPVLKKHFIPPFVIEDMNVTAGEIGRYVDSSIVECTIKVVGDADSLIWDTYQMAIKYMLQAPVRLISFHLLLDANTSAEGRSSGFPPRPTTTVAYFPHDKHA